MAAAGSLAVWAAWRWLDTSTRWLVFHQLTGRVALGRLSLELNSIDPPWLAESGADMDIRSEELLDAVGGKDNVNNVEACITRLRLEVKDPEKVNEDALRNAGAFGVVLQDSVVQVVVGPVADNLGESMTSLLDD